MVFWSADAVNLTLLVWSLRGATLAGINLKRGCSSMVELQLPKLITWVRFPSPAPVA